jgi:hypothetical protein
MERDDGMVDWDAAFEAIVAGLRPPRYQRVVRTAAQAAVAVALFAAAAWMLVQLVAAPLGDLGRPWR